MPHPSLWLHAVPQHGRGGRHADVVGARPPEGSAGVDCRKCFDLVPQGIGFEVCSRQGLCPRVLCALQGMFQQLCRAFKLADSLGDRWRATNGILQGCPLSVIHALMGA